MGLSWDVFFCLHVGGPITGGGGGGAYKRQFTVHGQNQKRENRNLKNRPIIETGDRLNKGRPTYSQVPQTSDSK